MTIEEMKAKKAELGYTNELISELSGVPLGTVQKIFSGETKAPRYDTVQKLVKLLEKDMSKNVIYDQNVDNSPSAVMESTIPYVAGYITETKRAKRHGIEDYMKPSKKKIGIADGKYRMPPDELLFDDEITEMFDEI